MVNLFANDVALEWLSEFESDPGAAVWEALALDLERGDMDAFEAQTALAAAEAVAIAYDVPASDTSERAISRVNLHAEAIHELDGIRDRAIDAAARVLTVEAELGDLWDDDDAAAWRAAVTDLIDRLQ